MGMRDGNVLSDEDMMYGWLCCDRCGNVMPPEWMRAVQNTVNQVIQAYYRLPVERRSGIRILELIGRYWRVDAKLFESEYHYHEVLLKTTDHLMQYLLNDHRADPPVFLFEELHAFIKELDLSLQLNLHVVHWTPNSLNIKKYVVSDNPYVLDAFKHIISVFCHRGMLSFPEKIAVINLLNGSQKTVEIEQDLQKSLDYLRLTKTSLQKNGFILPG